MNALSVQGVGEIVDDVVRLELLPKEKEELVAILCTCEGVLSVNEVFERFFEQPRIRLQEQAARTTYWIQSQIRILDQMSDLHREYRGEI